MKLTKNTKPKRLNIYEIWDLYLAEPEKETPQWIIKCLDTFYPNKDRDGIDMFLKYSKFQSGKLRSGYTEFSKYINGVV